MNRSIKFLHLAALTTAAAIFLTSASGVAAESRRNCGPHQSVVQRLAEGYGETRQSIGLGSNNSVIEVFASIETGSWTITVTKPDGETCLVASGQAFEGVNETLPPAGIDA